MSNPKVLVAMLLIAVLAPLASWAGPVNINTADAATLAQELKGVGQSRARAIVDYRTQNGAFASADDLIRVSGVTVRIVELNRDNILVSASPDH